MKYFKENRVPSTSYSISLDLTWKIFILEMISFSLGQVFSRPFQIPFQILNKIRGFQTRLNSPLPGWEFLKSTKNLNYLLKFPKVIVLDGE